MAHVRSTTHQAPFFSSEELLALIELSPCALILYHWLQIMAPNASVTEVELDDFCTFTQTDDRKGYSTKWVRTSFQELVSRDLISIERQYHGQVFKLRVWKPGQMMKHRGKTIKA